MDGRPSGEVCARVEAIALALRARGLAPGDRVALMSPNRADWIVANLGILFAGLRDGADLRDAGARPGAYIVDDSGARALFVDTPETAARVAGGRRRGARRSCSMRRPATRIAGGA